MLTCIFYSIHNGPLQHMLVAAAAIADAPPNTPALNDVPDAFPTLPLEDDKDLLALETEVTMSSRRKRELVSFRVVHIRNYSETGYSTVNNIFPV